MSFRRNHPAYDDRTSYDMWKEWTSSESETRRRKPRPPSEHTYPRRIDQLTQPTDGMTDIMLTGQAHDDGSVVVIITITRPHWGHPVHRVLRNKYRGHADWHITQGARVWVERSDLLDAMDAVQTNIRDARRAARN